MNRKHVLSFISILLVVGLFMTSVEALKSLELNVSGNCLNAPINITVTGRDDEPVGSADVLIYLDLRRVADLKTDNKGRAYFTPLEEGEYEIRADKGSQYQGVEEKIVVVFCGSCSDGIQNQEEEGIDCGGPCEPCTTTTTSTSTTTTSTSTSTTTTTSTSTSTTTTSTSTSTTTSTSTSTTLVETSDEGINPLFIAAGVVVLAVAAFLIYSRMRPSGAGAEEESGRGRIYDKYAETEKELSSGGYEGFKAKAVEEEKPGEQMGEIEKLEGELKALREDYPEKPPAEEPEVGKGRSALEEAGEKKPKDSKEDSLDEDLAEIEELESELKSLRMDWKKKEEKD